ncbi:MAG: hypothetical protein ACRDTA_26330, partial [Pseudonocardiaceae bacterium]
IGYARCSTDNKTSPRNAIGYASSADLLNRSTSTMAALLGRASSVVKTRMCVITRGSSGPAGLGHTYQQRPPAIIEPLPDPIPRDRPPYPLIIPPDDGWEDTRIWDDPPPEPESRADIPPF